MLSELVRRRDETSTDEQKIEINSKIYVALYTQLEMHTGNINVIRKLLNALDKGILPSDAQKALFELATKELEAAFKTKNLELVTLLTKNVIQKLLNDLDKSILTIDSQEALLKLTTKILETLFQKK